MQVFRCKNCGAEVPETAPESCSCGAKGSFEAVDISTDSKCMHCRGCH